MSKYTDMLTAEQLIRFIATDYVELSYEKAIWQRNDHIFICKTWIEHQNKIKREIHEDLCEQIEREFSDKFRVRCGSAISSVP